MLLTNPKMGLPPKRFSVLLIGDVTIDQNIIEHGTYEGPGGSLYFGGNIFLSLKDNVTILSPYGKDFPKNSIQNALWIPPVPGFDKTLIFRNSFSSGGRVQSIANVPSSHSFFNTTIKELSEKTYDIVFVAPLLPTIESDNLVVICKLEKNSLKVLLPQGMYRKVNPDMTISKQDWKQEKEVMRDFDIVVLSEKDMIHVEEHAQKGSSKKTAIIVTQAEKGCLIFSDGKKYHVPSFSVPEIIDSTGSGDIFAAAFSHAFKSTEDLVKSATFAHAVAGFSLRKRANQLQYTVNEIRDFAQRQGRSIYL